MKRLLARIIIHARVDTDQDLPRWVQALTDADPDLAKVAAESRRLTTRLRGDADAFVDTQVEAKERAERECRFLLGEGRPDSNFRGAKDDDEKTLERPAEIESVVASPDLPTLGASKHRSAVRLALAVVVVACLGWLGWTVSKENRFSELPFEQRQEQAPVVDVRPVITSLAASEQVFRKVAGGVRSLLVKATDTTNRVVATQSFNHTHQARRNLQSLGRDFGGALNRLGATLTTIHANSDSDQEGNETSQERDD